MIARGGHAADRRQPLCTLKTERAGAVEFETQIPFADLGRRDRSILPSAWPSLLMNRISNMHYQLQWYLVNASLVSDGVRKDQFERDLGR